jgi:hypothetical protein
MHELFKELKHYHVYINGVTINFPQLIIDKVLYDSKRLQGISLAWSK